MWNIIDTIQQPSIGLSYPRVPQCCLMHNPFQRQIISPSRSYVASPHQQTSELFTDITFGLIYCGRISNWTLNLRMQNEIAVHAHLGNASV